MSQSSKVGCLHLLPSGACIVATLTEALRSRAENDFSRILLILPTQRLGTFVAASLARSVGTACHPPRIQTLDQMIHDNIKLGPKLLPQEELIFWLGLLLEQKDFRHLKVGHERELSMFFSELATSGVGEDAFETFETILKEDIYRNDEHLGSLFERLMEIKDIYHSLQGELASHNFRLKSEAMAQGAFALGGELALNPSFQEFEEVWIAGFTSILASWRPLMRTLMTHDKCHFWLSAAPEDSPLGELKRLLLEMNPLVSYESPIRAHQAQQEVPIVSLESPLIEAFYSMEKADQWIRDGIPPSQIAILVTHEGDYHQALRMAAASFGIDCNIALATPLSQTPFGSLIHSILKAVRENRAWDLIFHPLVNSWLDIGQKPFAQRLLIQTSPPTASDLLSIMQLAEKEQVAELAPLFSLMEALHQARYAERPISFWLTEFRKILWTIGQHYLEQDDPICRSIEDAFNRFFEEAEFFTRHEKPLSLALFWQIFGDRLVNRDVRSTGEPLKGVQVISLAESRHIPFAAAIIVGCNEGTFPKGLPSDDLVDDYFKRRIGLPGWRQLEAMEDQTFYLLKDRIPHLILTRPRMKDDQNQIRSRFVEKLVAQDKALLIHESRTAQDLFFSHSDFEGKELQREGLDTRSPEQLVRRVSATSLGHLLTCPYRYRLYKLGVKPLEIPDPALDKRLEGEWLHKVIEMFFSHENHPFPDFNQENFKAVGLGRLLTLTMIYGPHGVENTPLFFQLKNHSWPQFLKHLEDLYGHDLKRGIEKSLKETQLDPDGRHQITIRDSNRGLTGVIDSIDRLPSMTIIIDYKRRGTPTVAKVQQGMAPQLILYAEGLKETLIEPLQRMVIGYWNIIDGCFVPCGVGSEVREEAMARGLAKKSTPDLEELTMTSKETWTKRENLIMERESFYADASDCTFCDYETLCRKNEPAQTARIEQQKDLSLGRLYDC